LEMSNQKGFALELAGLSEDDRKELAAVWELPERVRGKLRAQAEWHIGGPKTVGPYSPTDKNERHQADLLALPEDPTTDDQYALVMVDLASRHVGAVPLETKDSRAVKLAYEKLMRDDPDFDWPKNLQVDGGKEFAQLNRTVVRRGASVRVGRPGRHRNQAMVESANRVIGDALFAIQHVKELRTGEPNLEWVASLPGVVKRLNARWDRTHAELEAMEDRRDEQLEKIGEGDVGVFSKKKGWRVLPLEAKVLVVMEEPRDIRGRRLPSGNTASGFRSGDLRFGRKQHTIDEIVLSPGKQPRYRVSDIPETTFARNELRYVADK